MQMIFFRLQKQYIRWMKEKTEYIRVKNPTICTDFATKHKKLQQYATNRDRYEGKNETIKEKTFIRKE